LALDEALGAIGAAERVVKIDRELGAAKNQVGRLRTALEQAERRDAAADAQERRAVQAEQFAKFEQYAMARQTAINELAAGIEQAAKAYRRFMGLTDGMVGSIPTGTTLPAGVLGMGELGENRINALIAAEMYRHSDIHHIGEKGALPGARPGIEYFRLVPEQIEPAAEVVAAQNNSMLSHVRNQLG
jgi:hypothetical protein